MADDHDIKLIPLSQGKFAIVDAENYSRLVLYKWYFALGYARRNMGRKPNRKIIFMHRIIIGDIGGGHEVDHINRNKLDNRKCNLRICTRAQNQANRLQRIDKKNGKYKGTVKNGKGWGARIFGVEKFLWLGTFRTEEEAAIAYNKAAIEHYGEFARLNRVFASEHGYQIPYPSEYI